MLQQDLKYNLKSDHQIYSFSDWQCFYKLPTCVNLCSDYIISANLFFILQLNLYNLTGCLKLPVNVQSLRGFYEFFWYLSRCSDSIR